MKKRTSEYRKIYKRHYGIIPKDEFGRVYDIHHKDGNHENNLIDNLIAIPIQEHYNIHYANKNWKACVMIGLRMKLSVEEISKLNSMAAQKQVAEGTHHWKTEEHSISVSNRIKKSIANGTYHMLGGKIQKELQLKRSQQQIHQWNGPASNQQMLENGTHPSQIKKTCPYCNKVCGVANYAKWHGDKCKINKDNNGIH
jgi:hypothetical protein